MKSAYVCLNCGTGITQKHGGAETPENSEPEASGAMSDTETAGKPEQQELF